MGPRTVPSAGSSPRHTECSCFDELPQHPTGPRDARLNGGFGQLQQSCDLAIRKLVQRAKQQRFAVLLGEATRERQHLIRLVVAPVRWIGLAVASLSRRASVRLGSPRILQPEHRSRRGRTGQGAGAIDGHGAQPPLEACGVAHVADACDQNGCDLLQEILQVRRSGLVGEEHHGDPPAMFMPKGVQRGAIAVLGTGEERGSRVGRRLGHGFDHAPFWMRRSAASVTGSSGIPARIAGRDR